MEPLQCRLCTGKKCLIDTFASNYTNGPSMRSYILLATGVEIKEDDIVSTLVCKTCLNSTFNMYLFRVKSAKNDELLKEKAGLRKALESCPQITSINDSIKLEDKACNNEIAEFSCQAETAFVPEITIRKNSRNIFDSNSEPIEEVIKTSYHDSVQHALTLYPNIKLPEEVLSCNIAPQLVMKRCIDPTQIVPPIILSSEDISVFSVDVKRNAQDEISSGSKRFKLSRSPSVAVGSRLVDTYYCKYCSETFTNKKKLQRHEAQHRRDLREIEKRENDLDQSLMVVSKTNHVYLCHICSEMFTNKKRLAQHIKEHNTCKYCKTLVADLGIHLQTCSNSIMSYNYRVDLVRCDKDPAILAKYSKAFVSEYSSSDAEGMSFIQKTFLSEKEKVPACDNSINSITFLNLSKDLAQSCKIGVNLIANPSIMTLQGSISYKMPPNDTDDTFSFLDIKPITIQAPKTPVTVSCSKKLMPISRAGLQTTTSNNTNKFESVNLKMGKNNEVFITKANGETLKGCIVRVDKPPAKLYSSATKLSTSLKTCTPSKDATALNGIVIKPPIFKPHMKPLQERFMHNRSAHTLGAQKLNIAIKNVFSMSNSFSAAVMTDSKTITTTMNDMNDTKNTKMLKML